MQTTLTAVPYRPSSPITGESPYIYRGQNMLLRGQNVPGGLFFASYNGSSNLAEYPAFTALTGTLAFSPASRTVTGTATVFQTQLHIGQMIFTDAHRPLVVHTIETQLSFTAAELPTTTASGITGYRTPNLSALDQYRISLLWGNATLTDKGNIVAVGDGALYKNGAVLAGESLVATRQAQIALYSSATNNYSVEDLGFPAAPNTINTAITVIAAGGTKNTAAGFYSFRVAYYSDITDGYGDATPTLLSGGTTGYQIAAANSTFRFNFAATSAPPTKAGGYIIYATPFAGSSAISAVAAIEGPWYELRRIPFTSLSGGTYAGTIDFDYVDNDLSATLVAFDLDPPPDADWVSLFTGYLSLISTNGPGVNTTGRETETSPGPFVSTMLATNIDAYPATQRVATEKGETIIGFVNAAGRLFPMTPNKLQASTPTGLPSSPFTLRPFWERGFATPNNLIFADDTLYGFTTKGPYRSIATGDSSAASNDFASSVNAQMAEWNPGYVLLAFDPRNSAVCYFHSACSTNAEGYWETEVYIYSLVVNDWLPRVLLTDPTRDLIVTGVCTVQNELCYVAGGRRDGTTNRFDTFSWDTGIGISVAWFLCFSFLDGGVELISKYLHKLRVLGAVTSGKIQVYVVTPDSDIDIEDLTTGNNPTFEMDLDTSAAVRQYSIIKCRIRNALKWAIRVEGVSVSDGTIASVDQIHEIAVDYSVAGQQR